MFMRIFLHILGRPDAMTMDATHVGGALGNMRAPQKPEELELEHENDPSWEMATAVRHNGSWTHV